VMKERLCANALRQLNEQCQVQTNSEERSSDESRD